jgi:predicted negative regulator of RcsB-dependent stress response
MDDRLKQVHQTEVSESRINEDFVEWLKTKGPQYLLIALVGVCGYLGWYRWNQHKANYYNGAWAEFVQCRLPGSFEDIAERYADVPGLPQQAMRAAADIWLKSVQNGTVLGDVQAAEVLNEEQRLEYLERAGRIYHALANADDGSLAMTLYTVSAMQGLAVVAESNGDIDEATRWYDMAAGRADLFYPELARRIRERAATAGEYAEPVTLPTQAELPVVPPAPARQPVSIDEALRDLLLPPDEAGTG